MNKVSISKYTLIIFLWACTQKDQIDGDSFANYSDPLSRYHTTFAEYNNIDRSSHPIGVFDSGTGGLALLNVLIEMDSFDNLTGDESPDGIPDFANGDFIYFGDQANMPYGNYSAENNTKLLREHIIKDARFLMGNKYTSADQEKDVGKLPAKTIVVACNTATAYGLDDINNYLDNSKTEIQATGVIDAGARGALATFEEYEDGSIGVLATVGTVASEGYVKKLQQLKHELGYSGDIQIYQQGGLGIAEALDEEPNFINKYITSKHAEYRGPSITSALHKVDTSLFGAYNFKYQNNGMLCSEFSNCPDPQINSVENYIRYHLVTLLEKLRHSPNARPLKTLILGCTHYPYAADDIKMVLNELYNFRKNDSYHYRHLLNPEVKLIDPSLNTGKEVYKNLLRKNLLRTANDHRNIQFFISVPNTRNNQIELDSAGGFSYTYKYGRVAGTPGDYTVIVPFSKTNLSPEIYNRLRTQIPAVYSYIAMQLE